MGHGTHLILDALGGNLFFGGGPLRTCLGSIDRLGLFYKVNFILKRFNCIMYPRTYFICIFIIDLLIFKKFHNFRPDLYQFMQFSFESTS